jgi:hypothetical protein
MLDLHLLVPNRHQSFLAMASASRTPFAVQVPS